MKRRIGFLMGALLLIVLLAGCGGIAVESRVIPETQPTLTPDPADAGADSGAAPVPQADAPLANFLPRFGLREILIVVGILMAASIVIGVYLNLTDRSPVNDSVPPQDPPAQTGGVFRLLRLRPGVRSLLLTLSAWIIVLGLFTFVIIGGLLILAAALDQEEAVVLTEPSALLIGEQEPYLRLVPAQMACTLSGTSDESEQLLCDVNLEGAVLQLDVVLESGTFWYCSAFYDGQSVPCRASFNMGDLQTYIVINSDLGLSQSRWQALADSQLGGGWNEADWIKAGRMFAALFALVILIVLWRWSAAETESGSVPSRLLRVIYAFVVSLMVFGAANLLTVLVLLVFGFID